MSISTADSILSWGKEISLKGGLIKWLIVLGSVAILGIMGIQTYWLYRTWALREAEFDQKVRASLFRVANNLAGLANIPLPTRQDLVQQISTDYYLVNIDHAFDASDLEVALRYHLESALLQENFDYYVYDCSSDEMLYCNSISYDGQESDILNLTAAKGDMIYYFGVRFPSRGGFILSSMDMSILFTLLLLMTVVFFILALFIIRRQNRLVRFQTDFINNMTHEFKTPISTIKISNQVFLDEPAVQQNPRLHNYASIIQDQNERLNKQVEKLLQIAKVGKQNLQLKLETVPLHQLIHALKDSFDAKVKDKSGKILLDLQASKDKVLADQLHLQNILFNLLDNSIKYSPSAPFIEISSRDEPNGTVLEIKDQGVGIPKEFQKSVFDRFFRI
ncbi:MAG: HAMP domain-containing sensor histidine kinase, partial [Bacteroidota bacterium]